MYAQVRGLDTKVEKTLIKNSKIEIVVGDVFDDWQKVKIDNNYYYIYNKYLSKEKIKQNNNVKETNDNFLGYFNLTYYCPCSKCCGKYASGITASGTTATAGRTIAAPSRFAFGTKLNIDGQIYIVEDRGGAITGNKIDVYVNSHEEALKLGVRKNVPVYLEK